MMSSKMKKGTDKGKNHLGHIKTNELKRDGKDSNINKVSRTNLDNVRILNKNNLK